MCIRDRRWLWLQCLVFKIQSLVPGVLTAAALAAAGFTLVAQTPQRPVGTGRITVDVNKDGAAIPPTLYGIFYEEINHAGDGGLYAELVRNRGFEDANLPPACVREGSFIVPPRTAHFDTGQPSNWRLRWDETNPHPAWTIEPATGATATILSLIHISEPTRPY